MDLEKRIKNEFNNMEVVSLNANITRPAKPKRRPRKGFIVTVAIMLFATTGVMAASVVNRFNLRQLEVIVGELRMEMLEVVKYTSADGEITANYTTDCGLHIGLVAVGVHGSVADFYVMLDDASNRLDGDFHINHIMYALSDNPQVLGFAMSFLPFEIIDRNPHTGVVTLHTRHAFSVPIGDKDLHFTLQNIDNGDTVIDIGWQIQIATAVGDYIAIRNLEIARLSNGTIHEIVITPVSVLLAGSLIYTDGDEPRIFQCGWYEPVVDSCCMGIFMHLRDGSRISILPESGGGEIPEYGEAMYFYAHLVPMGIYLLDLSEVAAIEILGQIIGV